MFKQLCIVMAVCVCVLSVSAEKGNVAKATTILCIGDSITEGGKSFSVYRYPLNKKLMDAGYNITFIGPKSATKGGVTLSHAGYGGKKTASLDKLFNGIYAAHTADIILIHSAHNSFHHHKPVKGIVANLESIVNKARAVNPKVTILLGQGITSGKLPKYSYIPQLNVEVGKLAKRLHTEQSPVIAVDHATGFDWKTDTTKDKVHPNAQGAEKMASKWFEALEKLPQLKKGSAAAR
ncbi:cellulose-binding, family II, bacterial type [Lentisphaera araneosa HTCC2155]|uniref:Cellulose-binding, family II, bacterial type n=1 Tax=Lentisphaera araneosa HTCC2155 TaxID=313628 RepID=A6DIE9_9BACT|nr:GDSL-type esterase/lipase family protein [Lentisphaera araneosa]EDM28803.1 cellulose-binding, family II, bacterial type [Lentisphaera araneosa HTCC2155]